MNLLLHSQWANRFSFVFLFVIFVAKLYNLEILVIGAGNQFSHNRCLHINLISSFSALSAWIRDGAVHHWRNIDSCRKHKIRTRLPQGRSGSDFVGLVPVVGLDLRCGAGRVAALTCPRHVIHYRSRSSPSDQKTKRPPLTGRPFRFWCRWWDSNPHGVATNGF